MAKRSQDAPKVDLAQFSPEECAQIWSVLQKDFHLRFQEDQRLQRMKTQLAKAGKKAATLGSDPDFNEKYCIICFSTFFFFFNPKEQCFLCLCNVCRSCRRYLKNEERYLCLLCEEEREYTAKECAWFYDGATKKFFVSGASGGSLPSLGAPEGDNNPMTEQMRRYLQQFVTRYKQEEEPKPFQDSIQANVAHRNFSSAPPKPDRGHLREDLVKQITGHQVMRFHQKVSDVTSDVERYLRGNVRYEIPESGVDPTYDQQMKAFRAAVASVLRNFSQSLYIAIEGHHSKTKESVGDVQMGVQQVLQDEVESLVGCRVDIPVDDDAVSIVSEDFGNAGERGPSIHEKLADFLLSKWLSDHEAYLDDQKMTASDLYAESALERVLARKAEGHGLPEEDSNGLFGSEETDPDFLSAGGTALFEGDSREVVENGRSSLSSNGSGGNWLFGGRPTTKCGDALRGFTRPNVSDEMSEDRWEDLKVMDDDSDDDTLSSGHSNTRKMSIASLDFDDVYRRNLTLAKDSDAPRGKLEQSSRSEDSGVHVSSSSPTTLTRKESLGFSRMDWSFNERSDPHFVAKPKRVTVEEGDCAVISVAVDGTPPIDVFWHRCSTAELIQLEESDRVEFFSAPDHPGKVSLLLWDTKTEDAGEYLASAVNSNGSTQQGFRLMVTERSSTITCPQFLDEVADNEVREGGTARLLCRVQGHPTPRIRFLRKGVPVRNGEKFAITRIGDRSLSLAIHDFQREDEGSYRCMATNCAGSVHCDANVRIAAAAGRRLKLKPTKDVFIADQTPAIDQSPAVKVKAQVSRLSAQTPSLTRIEPLSRAVVSPAELAAAQQRQESAERRMKTRTPQTPTLIRHQEIRKEETLPAIDMSEFELRPGENDQVKMDCGLHRVDSAHRKKFFVKRSSEEDKERKKKEELELRARRERAEREVEEKLRKEKEAREKRQKMRDEEREADLKERQERWEKEQREKEEKEMKEKVERERMAWKEREENEKEEERKRRSGEERRKKREEEERLLRRERREKERKGREEKEKKEKELKEKAEKEEKERREIEERIRQRRLRREEIERQEEERRTRRRGERAPPREEEEREEVESCFSEDLPSFSVEGESYDLYDQYSLVSGQSDLDDRSERSDRVTDIRTLIESGRLRPSFAPNMFASFRTRKFPSVPEIRSQFARRGAYTKRPAPQPVKISGKTRSAKKFSETAVSVQSTSEDFRTVTLKKTAIDVTKL